jgi:hypothetical protein
MLKPLSAKDFISKLNAAGNFPIVSNDIASNIYFDANDDTLVSIASGLLQQDIKAVTGKSPFLLNHLKGPQNNLIIAGTIQQSAIIKHLIKEGKINVDGIRNSWEAYQIKVVEHPFDNVDRALIIVGSDKRGAAYGIFELSKQMGVSPWYWWADVPVKKSRNIYVVNDSTLQDAPKVKYRGIFLNDEAPALSGWTKEKFGGMNHHFYTKVFELLLRLKANYLWPAMWGNAFNDDDKLNPVYANMYGIVMGTSHHEPMLRAQQEWKRYGKGAWNYNTNKATLQSFWKKGIQNMGTHESIVTIGMRGDGDEPMTEGTAINLLEGIVSDQRKIIESVTEKPAAETPQLWALYKEVQAYYDQGMRVPDDVTLLLCDDNWGNIRKLPSLTEKPRKGGYGIYYHFDYVGDPRNYKWLNTNNLARVWEQMNLAWEYNARQIWIVNVGDLKPMELPISFFLDDAWNPKTFNAGNVGAYYSHWASEQFGAQYAKSIGNLLQKYSLYNARRKPELIDANTYSIQHYNEANKITADYEVLLKEALVVQKQLPVAYQDAFYQLVLHPVEACLNLNAMYVAAANNSYYAARKDPLANKYADEVISRFQKDSLISDYYNHKLSNGKWNHFMDQTHIGYTYWQQPEKQILPQIKYLKNSGLSSKKTVPQSQSIINNRPKRLSGIDFYEINKAVSIEATHYSSKENGNDINWQIIADIGRDVSGITTFPVTHAALDLSKNSPLLSYNFQSSSKGMASINIYSSPTLDFQHKGGLLFAVSIDDQAPITLNLNGDLDETTWRKAVADNIIIKRTNFKIEKSGKHTLKLWAIDPGVIFQKVIIDFGGLKQSYLGAPETKF